MHGRCSLLASIIVLGACGGSSTAAPAPQTAASVAEVEDPSVEVHRRGGKKLIAEIGSAGGTLELDNGARLEVPAGALSEPTEITFAQGGHTTAFSNREFERAIGPVLEIAPEISPSVPLVVSVPTNQLPEGFTENDLALGLEILSSSQRAVQMQGVQTRWDYFPASSKSGRFVAELGQVPGYRMQFLVSKGN